MVTWNLLAPGFATPAKYPWVSADALAWPQRQDRIVRRLAEMDADAVCLQEVELAAWPALSDAVGALGYESVLQQTKGDHPYANAVLLRRGVLQLERCESRSRDRRWVMTVVPRCWKVLAFLGL